MLKSFTLNRRSVLVATLLALFGALLSGPATAEDIYVEVDHAMLLRFDTDVDLVHVANPSIADVTVESPRMLFVIGLNPGQTGLFILDRQGNEMIVGDILVTASESHEVTVNRNAQESIYSCSPRCTQVEGTGQLNSGAFDTTDSESGDGDAAVDLSGLGLTDE
jgi:hypothetical protein